jgi:hypothetical protein
LDSKLVRTDILVQRVSKKQVKHLGVTSITKKSKWEKDWVFYGFQGNMLVLFMLVIAPLEYRKTSILSKSHVHFRKITIT